MPHQRNAEDNDKRDVKKREKISEKEAKKEKNVASWLGIYLSYALPDVRCCNRGDFIVLQGAHSNAEYIMPCNREIDGMTIFIVQS
uniref:Uncharacterized protein n=1 Tax=Nelumbo nucifera TaxID=4432 RepID=A0A822ZTZ5_NELNU|nr:TPA_asm: hypothetical protein HUJ06_003578 [Nelumbo nucifera]